MGERHPVRDRTLVLRVLVPSLETRLRDKMKESDDLAAGKMPPNSTPADYLAKETLVDLDGVTCAPVSEGSTRWNFHCDGAVYPARLVNLPCPVELHKTHDHVMFYKSADIAQLLIVYEDEMAMEEAENVSGYKHDDFPSYYHSGLTPPLKRVVERRFGAREHKAVPPPRGEVADIEDEVKALIERIGETSTSNASGGGGGGGGRGAKAKTKSTASSKVIEEVVDDIVDYEPWMDDFGREPNGIEFDSEDVLASKHPELFLHPTEIAEIVKIETEKEEIAKAAAAKKTEKKKKTKKKAAAASVEPQVGIPPKRHMEEVDEITQVAMSMTQADPDDIDLLGAEFDNFFDDDEFGAIDFE